MRGVMEENQIKTGDTRLKYLCKYCNKDLSNSIQCHGANPSAWEYLNDGEHCHIECYIEECVKMSLVKLKE
jgi:hypothetical protein